MTVFVMLTEAQVEESRRRPHMADDREGVIEIVMAEAKDPQVCNHGDWHVWQVDDAEGGSEYLPARMADWVVSVVTVDTGEFRTEWWDTQLAGVPCVSRAWTVYDHGLGMYHREERG